MKKKARYDPRTTEMPGTQPAFYEAPHEYTPQPGVIVDTLGAKNATVARVSVAKRSSWTGPADYEFTASDSSKREQGDRYDPLTGEMLALGRAFQQVGRDMVREASRRVESLMAEQARPPKKSRAQVRHRSLEEWVSTLEEKNGSFTVDQVTRIPVSHNRFLVIRKDSVLLEGPSGHVIMRFDRS